MSLVLVVPNPQILLTQLGNHISNFMCSMEAVFFLIKVCVQEINQEYQMPMPYEAEHYDRVSANYPDETSDANYEMDDIHYR